MKGSSWNCRCTLPALMLAMLSGACADQGTGSGGLLGVDAAPRASLTSVEEQELKTRLENEKKRIADAQEASKPKYDSLKVQWEKFKKTGTFPSGTMMMCDPIQYVATTKIVGPEGGDVDFGPHKFSIPVGALSKATVITAEAPTSLLVAARFSPHGTKFLLPPRLSLSYKHCTTQSDPGKKIAYFKTVDGQPQVLEWTASQEEAAAGYVRSLIWHFSDYGIGWPNWGEW